MPWVVAPIGLDPKKLFQGIDWCQMVQLASNSRARSPLNLTSREEYWGCLDQFMGLIVSGVVWLTLLQGFFKYIITVIKLPSVIHLSCVFLFFSFFFPFFLVQLFFFLLFAFFIPSLWFFFAFLLLPFSFIAQLFPQINFTYLQLFMSFLHIFLWLLFNLCAGIWNSSYFISLPISPWINFGYSFLQQKKMYICESWSRQPQIEATTLWVIFGKEGPWESMITFYDELSKWEQLK